jgi:hypothetical protein
MQNARQMNAESAAYTGDHANAGMRNSIAELTSACPDISGKRGELLPSRYREGVPASVCVDERRVRIARWLEFTDDGFVCSIGA